MFHFKHKETIKIINTALTALKKERSINMNKRWCFSIEEVRAIILIRFSVSLLKENIHLNVIGEYYSYFLVY